MAIRRGVTALLCLLAVLTAAQAAEPAKVDDRVTIKVYVPDATSTAVFWRSQVAIFNEFVKTHPDINVVAAQGIQLENLSDATLMSIAGGTAPDIFDVYYQSMGTYIEQGFIAPLDEYIDKWEGKDKVPPQCWPVVTGQDGKRYGAVYLWPTVYLVYRRDFFEQAGLDPSRPPENWKTPCNVPSTFRLIHARGTQSDPGPACQRVGIAPDGDGRHRRMP